MRKLKLFIYILGVFYAVTACGAKEQTGETLQQTADSESEPVTISDGYISGDDMTEGNFSEDRIPEGDHETEEMAELHAPSKEEVFSMREMVLDGMSEEEITRLTENIKTANLQMERAYLYENIFGRLSDQDSPYWQYFDQEGDIQLGWWYHGNICSMERIIMAEGITEEEFYEKYQEPGIVYNRFDAENFIELLEDMKTSVHNELLLADLQQLIDLTYMAADTHEVGYANDIYKILHDMDYFLLRYGIEDVGKYTQDAGVVSTYYGMLAVYGAEPFEADY